MAIKNDPFVLTLVDLTIPLEPKLALIKECVKSQKDSMVVSIGKIEYLQKKKPLWEADSVVSLSSIQSVPLFMKEWCSRR